MLCRKGIDIMANGRKIMRFSGILIVLLGVLGFQMEVFSKVGTPDEDSKVRSDLIMINTIAKQEKPELPAVVFLHGTHTKMMAEQNKDCTTCHKDVNGKMSYKFMRLKDGTPAELKEIYHSNCISCHESENKAGRKSGPLAGECRSCHQKEPELTVKRADAGMDNTLHYRHWSSKIIAQDKGQDTNCGSCHHEYDKYSKKLVYNKGKEESCRACHTSKPEGDVKTDKMDAFHSECVTCHLDLSKAGVDKYGPVECAGCHGEKELAKVKAEDKKLLKKLGGTLPRLPRNQPDAVLMTSSVNDRKVDSSKKQLAGMMPPVAFDHKNHESSTKSCRSCHHKTLQACSECHTEKGTKKGGYVTLENAMHKPDSDRSCTGCHAKEQKKPECAGCHDLIPQNKQSERTCSVCHEKIKDDSQADLTTLAASAKAARAKEIISERPDSPNLPSIDAIPEFVTINALENEYKPCKLPHRKIIMSLVKKMKGDKLANAFHSTPLAVCQSCHHNSPASATPPSCASCHAKPFLGKDGRPGLKAAYHGQCMTCHKSMGIEKPVSTDCTACHEKK
jgi:hypothetical protein